MGTAEGDSELAAVAVAHGAAAFTFRLLAHAPHFLKIEGAGYDLNAAQIIEPPSCAPHLPPTGAPTVPGEGPVQNATVVASATAPLGGSAVDGVFRYRWLMDASRAGAAETSHLVAPPNITFLNESVVLGDDQATDKLQHEHAILLSDGEVAWSSEFAFRLLEAVMSVPRQASRSFYGPQTLTASRWTLTHEHLADDMNIEFANGTSALLVRISSAAFVHASPQLVRLDGVRGRFFSRRLHHAVVRFVTREGAETGAAQHIMSSRYGCTTAVSAPLYVSLTAPTTAEDAAQFQPFETWPRETLLLLTMLEELPAGLHVTAGLRYLLRRLDGQVHPRYPTAAAVAWPTAHNQSYIEFMESAFVGDLRHTRRLILHEKAHFLWANLFTQSLRSEWTALAGWFEDSNATSGWSTTQQTTFVSPYAHALNPNEDMAESISFYVENPSRLLACCPAKFAFLRDRIMQGYRYVSRVRPDLTFQVLNLMPDYTYPGKITRVAIDVHGAPTADKQCTVEIALHTLGGVFDGAQSAYLRLFSEAGTWVDVTLRPTNAPNNSVLARTFTLSRYAKAGLWRPQQIVLRDLAGNQRFAGTNDFGWRLHVDNPLEDLAPPSFVAGSLALSANATTLEGHPVYFVTVSWLLAEQVAMKQPLISP